jgi:hypothetical protein
MLKGLKILQKKTFVVVVACPKLQTDRRKDEQKGIKLKKYGLMRLRVASKTIE